MSVEHEKPTETNPQSGSQPDVESVLLAEQEKFKRAVEAGKWEDLTASAFPYIVASQERPFYLNKLAIINSEMKQIEENAPMMQEQEDAVAILRGRIKELAKGASETVKLLYPNVKPEYEKQSIDPQELSKIEAFVQEGAIDQLNDDNIPGWDLLSSDQRLLYRLNAMQIYYSKWNSVAEDNSLDQGDQLGYTQKAEDGKRMPNIKRIHKIIEEKVIARHLKEWFDEAKKEGLDENNPMIMAAKKLTDK